MNGVQEPTLWWDTPAAYDLGRGFAPSQLKAFRRSLRYSLERVEEIARASARWEPFPADVLADYFRTLRFEFGDRYRAGLREFALRAAAHGLLENAPPFEFVALDGAGRERGLTAA